MAPELFAEDGEYSTASDLWSLGCVLYELAVGNPPFVSNNFEELVEMIIWADVPLSHRRTLEKSNNRSPQPTVPRLTARIDTKGTAKPFEMGGSSETSILGFKIDAKTSKNSR